MEAGRRLQKIHTSQLTVRLVNLIRTTARKKYSCAMFTRVRGSLLQFLQPAKKVYRSGGGHSAAQRRREKVRRVWRQRCRRKKINVCNGHCANTRGGTPPEGFLFPTYGETCAPACAVIRATPRPSCLLSSPRKRTRRRGKNDFSPSAKASLRKRGLAFSPSA